MYWLCSVLCILLLSVGLACAPDGVSSGPGGEPLPIVGPRGHALIDVTALPAVRARRPVLVAHRGGVIAPDAPEASLAAIRLAAETGYDMVELDVQETADHQAVIFHVLDMSRACGINKRIYELSCAEATAIRFRASDQHVATLDEALALCAAMKLGVMLDVKTRRDTPNSDAFFQEIGRLVEKHGLTSATVTISRHPLLEKQLAGKVMFVITPQEVDRVAAGETVDLKGRYLFRLPRDLPDDLIPKLQQNSVFIIAAINTFLYPAHAHLELARKDIERLRAAGVDGFQIDSVYGQFFGDRR